MIVDLCSEVYILNNELHCLGASGIWSWVYPDTTWPPFVRVRLRA